MPRSINCYRPGGDFPAVSVTGPECSLDCKHCSRRYLEGMRPAKSPEALLALAEGLESSGGKGFLLSGGSDRAGKVPLMRFVPAIRRIKETTSLLVNAHVGLAPFDELRALVRAGVDSFSVDVYGSDSAIAEVSGLDATAEDYVRVAADLKHLGAPVVAPHICIGIERGEVVGEPRAIELLRPVAPEAVVLLVMTPTKGTAFEGVAPPAEADVLKVIRETRAALPDARLLLGCMRPRRERAWEVEAARSGLDGIAMPSIGTVSRLKAEGWAVSEKRTCCSIP